MITECATCKYCEGDLSISNPDPYICTLTSYLTDIEGLCPKYEPNDGGGGDRE